jgi:chromosome segregation ATPase
LVLNPSKPAEHRSWQKELKVQIEKLGQAHDAALHERDLAQNDLSTVRSQLSNATAVIADLRANNATGERRYAEACEKLADLQSTLASANSRIELLTTQSAEKDDENRQIREETRQLAHRVQDLRTR